MTDSKPLWLTCSDCAGDYPVGGSKLLPPAQTSPESAEHHADDCPIAKALRQRGQTADREAHIPRRVEV